MATTIENPVALPELSKNDLSRYSRHLLLPEVGVEGQRKLKAAKVLCVGAGGLGAPLAFYLAAAGVGTGAAPSGKYNSTAFKALIAEAGGSVTSATAACTSYVQSKSAPTTSSAGNASPTTGSSVNHASGRPASPGRSATHSHGGGHGSAGGRH